MIAIANIAFAQPDSIWSRTYGGENLDYCYSVIQTVDNGFVLAGFTDSFGAGGYDLYMVKTNSEGGHEWSQTYGGIRTEMGSSTIQKANGGYLLAGETNSFWPGFKDMWLVETNAEGDSVWSQSFAFDENNDDEGYVIIQTEEGGFALAGDTRPIGGDWNRTYLIKLDNNQEAIWSRAYGGDGDGFCISMIQSEDRGFVIAGWTDTYGAANEDMYMIKINADGDSLWHQIFGGDNEEICHSIIQTMDGGYALAGDTDSFGAGGFDMYLVKTDVEGNFLWSRTYGGRDDDKCNSVIQAEDGGYILSGLTRSFGAGGSDIWLMRTNEAGDSLWSETFGGENNETSHSFLRTPDGGYILSGVTNSFGAGDVDMWLVKTGPDPVSAPNEPPEPLTNTFILNPAYPNPFNSTATIEYAVSFASKVTLSLYNLSGQRIETLVNGTIQAGVHRVMLDAGDMASGLYFVRLEGLEESFTQKIMLVK